MVVRYNEDRKKKCRRCGGLGTIPTPDGKHNEICPICGGSGAREKPVEVDWQSRDC